MVGTAVIEKTDMNRKEVLGKKEGYRRIAVRLYYPGVEDGPARSLDFLSEGKRKGFGKKPNFSLYKQRIAIYEGLKMREGSFPLILFSHGYSGYIEQNSDLCQYLAENGYIVASIGHPYEANETVYPDGTSVLFDKSLYLKMFKPLIPAVIDLYRLRGKKMNAEEALELFNRHQKRYEAFVRERVPEWANDDKLALDAIKDLAEDECSIFYHKIDLSNGIGITGHSYGGALAYYHCIYDDEISCGINIDGGIFGEYGTHINQKPFMQILNPSNVNVVSRSLLYHEGPVHYLVFRDMEHNGFTDWKLVVRKESTMGKADPVLALDTLNAAHLAFFDRYLKKKNEGQGKLDIDERQLQEYKVC